MAKSASNHGLAPADCGRFIATTTSQATATTCDRDDKFDERA
jgi:hypothetical protein